MPFKVELRKLLFELICSPLKKSSAVDTETFATRRVPMIYNSTVRKISSLCAWCTPVFSSSIYHCKWILILQTAVLRSFVTSYGFPLLFRRHLDCHVCYGYSLSLYYFESHSQQVLHGILFHSPELHLHEILLC